MKIVNFVALFLLHVFSNTLQAEGSSCDLSKCSVVIYQDCAASPGCGIVNGISCSYLSGGISANPTCARNPCPAVVGNGNWQSVCSGIDAIDIIGPCKAQLAKQSNGGLPFSKIFQPGFHGVWQTYEKGTHFGDSVLSVKLSCADTDECASNSTNNCSSNALCTNTVGSYNCTCKSGYNGDGYTCTDIDECSVGTHQCAANADCTNTLGAHTCACKFGYFGDGMTCDHGANRVVCDENFMAIYLDKRTQLYNTSVITLRDPSCTAKLYLPNNELGLITAFDKCGTTKTQTTTHVVYENEVIGNMAHPSGVTRVSGKKITFTCSLQRHRDTSNVNLAPTTNYITASEAGYGNFTVSLSMYNDSSFATKHSSFPASVKLDQRVYFEVQTGSNDSDIVLLIEKCSSSPTTNKYHPSSYDLVKNRCAVDSTVQFHSIKLSHKMRFSFKSFQFVGQSQVYLHCQIFMCHKQSSDSRCSSGCAGNNINRLRRSISSNSETYKVEERAVFVAEDILKSVKRRSTEQKQQIKNYAPSKSYDLNIGPIVQSQPGSGVSADSNTGKSSKEGFTMVHGMILLAALFATGFAVFATKAVVKKFRKANVEEKVVEKEEGQANKGFELFTVS